MLGQLWDDKAVRRRRPKWRLVGFLGLTSLMGVCAPAATANALTTSKSSHHEGKIILTITDFSTVNDAFYQEVSRYYHQIHPNVTLNWNTVAQTQYYQDIGIELAGTNAPDLFFYREGDLGGYQEGTMDVLLKQGLIQPLDPSGPPPAKWLGEWGKNGEEGFVPGINESGGQVYSFPYTDSLTWGDGYMYYNKALFQQAGISSPPTNWSQLESDCQAIVSKTSQSCIAAPFDSISDFERLWFAFAGSIQTDQLFDYKTGSFDLLEPNMVSAFAEMQKLYKANDFVPGVYSSSQSRAQLVAGKAAIYFDGAWMPGVFQNTYNWPAADWGVAGDPRPATGPDGGWDALNTQNEYFLSKTSRHAAQAWQFIQWMTQPDGWYVRNYYAHGLGILAYANNHKLLGRDPVLTQLHAIATNSAVRMRVVAPEPLVQCPLLANSTAFSDASAVFATNNALYNAFMDALTKGTDYTTAVTPLVQQAQNTLTRELGVEAQLGLHVSISCFQFPKWNYNQNYVPPTTTKAKR